MEAHHELNYFTDELYRYYVEHGKILSQGILDILDKTPLELSDKEKELYVKFIIPRRQQMKQALKARFITSGARKEAWHSHLLYCSQSIIGQIAAEVWIEEGSLVIQPTVPRGSITLSVPAPEILPRLSSPSSHAKQTSQPKPDPVPPDRKSVA